MSGTLMTLPRAKCAPGATGAGCRGAHGARGRLCVGVGAVSCGGSRGRRFSRDVLPEHFMQSVRLRVLLSRALKTQVRSSSKE